MNLLDRAVGWFDPMAGLRRISARRAIEVQGRAYDAAKRDHRTASWQTPGSSSNAEAAASEEIVRNRSRDLVRNNGYALQVVETYADSVVGTGIVGAPTGLKGRNAKKVAADWRSWCETCDHDDDQDFNGLVWTATKGMAESGAAIIRFRRQRFDANTRIAPLKLQVLEPDFIDPLKDGTVAGGGFIDRGIEYDAEGRKVAYWLLPAHPGDVASWRTKTMVSERVPANEVVYLFNKLRPGQDRGMPILAPAIMTLQDLRSYFSAELVRKRTAACMVGFITTTDEDLQIGVDPDTQKGKRYGPQKQRMEPGMLTRAAVTAHVDEVRIVSETRIEEAISLLLDVEKTVVEGAGAVGLAALLPLKNGAARPEFAGRKIGVILTGGNIDPRFLANVILRNLARSGRIGRLAVLLNDRVGELAKIAEIFTRNGANIIEVSHQRIFGVLSAKGSEVEIEYEIRDKSALDGLMDDMDLAGYAYEVMTISGRRPGRSLRGRH